ncbi:PD-(D/E)XK nuclease family protein [Rhodoferax sp. AJA081-3]|uniref:PD-(D/E)XK nuclease family protein n=1 Tax=Rhodoferax sp. AJA081-3 TaxID=2752316 RepID=UPI001FD77D97|nr:PD-(D/E)XK nuclease family protein [Rhodoferax sp. AJA081-3]
MTSIAKIDFPGARNADAAERHPAVQLWTHAVHGLLPRVHAEMSLRRAHPARTLVLLPYAQLRPLATRLWAQQFPDGFAPQFETTQNWSTAMGWPRPGATDIAFDMAQDTLTASALLRAAGLGAQQDALAGLLVQAAHQLGPLAAARAPGDRVTWVLEARDAAVTGMESAVLAMEAAVARIAVEWAGQSAYASDLLFDAGIRDGVDCLLMVQGLATDPMLPALRQVWGELMTSLPLAVNPASESGVDASAIAWHACRDAEDEAHRTAACAIAHIAAGRYPLALVSSDRALTRRVRSMLEGVDVQIRDENGWKLSTSHAGAQVMALLKAAVWNASSDAVLGWLKGAPAFASSVAELETAIRRDQTSDWRRVVQGTAVQKSPSCQQCHAAANAVRDGLQGSRTLTGWLPALRAALQASGLWDYLNTDEAGTKVLAALRLAGPALQAWEALSQQALWSARRMDLAEFTHWVNQALEGASFQPPYPLHEQLVILPMSQMLGRPFAAVVLAGCDEVRLNPSPEPPGGWTAAQRAALGLPSRDDLQAIALAAWQHALQTPFCDVLWRCSDDTGETLLPSVLVQQVQLARGNPPLAEDPRLNRDLVPAPVLQPLPVGQLVPVAHLSASAYEDLRNCPYRFFAMRQLGLQSVDELETSVDKRDFGLWIHEVLKRFHEALALRNHPDAAVKLQLLDEASVATTESMGLGEGEFLPFAAAWPTVRDGYLRWLERHEASGATFNSAEVAQTQRIGPVKLLGRIDRIDQLADGSVLVLDYKTEASAKTAGRVKDPLEDTQLAFYAALLPNDTLQAAYVNVGEKDGTKSHAQPDVVEARDALIHGIVVDMERIAKGAALPALGEGATCDFCQARGLCRKDFWKTV